jgi:hypothetical protein
MGFLRHANRMASLLDLPAEPCLTPSAQSHEFACQRVAQACNTLDFNARHHVGREPKHVFAFSFHAPARFSAGTFLKIFAQSPVCCRRGIAHAGRGICTRLGKSRRPLGRADKSSSSGSTCGGDSHCHSRRRKRHSTEGIIIAVGSALQSPFAAGAVAECLDGRGGSLHRRVDFGLARIATWAGASRHLVRSLGNDEAGA